jgi:hypothetical protein
MFLKQSFPSSQHRCERHSGVFCKNPLDREDFRLMPFCFAKILARRRIFSQRLRLTMSSPAINLGPKHVATGDTSTKRVAIFNK